MLLSSKKLEPLPDEKFFGNRWRREDIWACKHGIYTIIEESGWACYGASLDCKCCGMNYCYVDEPDWTNLKPIGPPPKKLRKPQPWPTEDFCTRCVEK